MASIADYGQRPRSIELENGEVIDGVRRVTHEDLSLAERKRLVADSRRMRTRASQRLHLHVDGGGHRVVYPEDIADASHLKAKEAGDS